jgi:hypothetical protein
VLRWFGSLEGWNVHTFGSSNALCSVFSNSPEIPDTIDGTKTTITAHPIPAQRPPSPIAFLSIILPQPGGPRGNMLDGGCTPVCRYTSGCVRGIKTNSSISSMHGLTPPKSARCMAGGACTFVQPTWLHLVVLPSSPCIEHSLCLLDGAVVVDGALSVFLEEEQALDVEHLQRVWRSAPGAG